MIEEKTTRQVINPEGTFANAVRKKVNQFLRYELYQQSYASWQMRTRPGAKVFRVRCG